MIADKIRNARKALSALGGKVNEDVWAAIKCIQHELDDAGDMVETAESDWAVPKDAPAPMNQEQAATVAQA